MSSWPLAYSENCFSVFHTEDVLSSILQGRVRWTATFVNPLLLYKKSRIRETLNLLTNADISTYTKSCFLLIYLYKYIFIYFLLFRNVFFPWEGGGVGVFSKFLSFWVTELLCQNCNTFVLLFLLVSTKPLYNWNARVAKLVWQCNGCTVVLCTKARKKPFCQKRSSNYFLRSFCYFCILHLGLVHV